MSTDSIESLSLKIDFLSSRVEALEEEVKELKEAAKSNVVSGYTLVEPSSSAASAVGDQLPVATYDYNYLATTIPPVPEDVVRACALLSGGRLTFRQRAERAWAAGHWATVCARGQARQTKANYTNRSRQRLLRGAPCPWFPTPLVV